MLTLGQNWKRNLFVVALTIAGLGRDSIAADVKEAATTFASHAPMRPLPAPSKRPKIGRAHV